MRNLSGREHLLLMAALAVAVGFALFGFRYRPHAARLRDLSVRRELVEQQLAAARWPADAGDPQRLSAERDALREQLGRLRDRLQDQESRFVSGGAPAAMDELRVRISDLAREHRIRLIENLACPEQELREFVGLRDSAAGGLVRFLTLGEPYRFRARRLALETDFEGLRGFLAGLAALEQRVVVLRFEISVSATRGHGPTPLDIRLLLTF
ncbi:MAG: hypothetical protein ACYTHK_08880 [Planctomycetota bacterium]|jgi:hypothetical protein